MSLPIDETHDPALRSWVESANDDASDFPIQNLPLGRFRRPEDLDWSIGVAIGDQVFDLRRARMIDHSDMNRLIRLRPDTRRELRRAISQVLKAGRTHRETFEAALVPQAKVELGLPCHIGDYTDFYVGIHHAYAVGKLFRPDQPLLPNYKWVPIGYHGRASTIHPSGHSFPRPNGQCKSADDDAPTLGPSRRLDYELEVGIVIGRPNAYGEPITMARAEDHVIGLTLFNDWSARDFQAWEYQPLGPFLSKNFASTLSPWIMTIDALAPFRRPFGRHDSDPRPLPYLDSEANRKHGAFDVELEILLETESMRRAGLPAERIARSNFAEAAYWTVAQLVAHHTVNGCSLSTGDLFGSGTLSGARPQDAGSLLELTKGGREPITLANGQRRTFLEDGDCVTLRGSCSRDGFRRIGFGECRATVLPARPVD